jgi:outer membrane protein TolC
MRYLLRKTNRLWRPVLALLVTFAPAAGQGSPPARRTVSLPEAIDLALENNRDLAGARLELDGAEQRVREAWGSVFPVLNLNMSYARNLSVPGNFLPRIIFDPDADPDELVAVKFGADNAWSLQLRAEQPLFEASAFIGVGAADRFRGLQREVVRGRTISVTTRVKLAYYAALLANEGVRLTENTVRRVRQTLEETRRMAEAGVSSSYDVLRLEVELANLEPGLRRSANAAEAAKRNLAVELALEDGGAVEVTGSLLDIELGDPVIAASNGGVSAAGTILSEARAVDLAIENRSDIRQLALTEQLRVAELRAEQSDYLPKLTLFGTYSIAAQQNGDPDFFGASDRQRSYGRQIGLQLSLPLFNGMKRPARTAQKRAVIEQVRTQQELLRDRVESDVRTLLDGVAEAHDRALAQRLARSQAGRGYEIARAQYREGVGSQLEVTDAENALRQSEFNYAEAMHDFLTARARLEEAVGVVPELQRGGSLAAATNTRSR